MIELFIGLLMGHAIADYALQSGDMARGKRRSYRPEPPAGQKFAPSWYFWLTAHALIHGSAVWIVTGTCYLGVLETIAHWLIDFGKCENKYGMKTDQALHVLCKVIWVLLLWG